jgi:hypothetical protein
MEHHRTDLNRSARFSNTARTRYGDKAMALEKPHNFSRLNFAADKGGQLER